MSLTRPVRSRTPGERQPGHFRVDIQGLRGVAVLMVVIYHAGWALPGGFVGVDVFFVISGYVIAAGLDRELQQTGTISLRSFYLRRVRRLMPAMATVSVVTLCGTVLLHSPFGVQPLAARTAVAASLWVANLYLYATGGDYFSNAAELNPFLHTWSLSVEEQFYVVFPAVLLAAWRVKVRRSGAGSRTTLVWVLTLGCALSFAGMIRINGGVELGRLTLDERFSFYFSVTRFWEFLVGALLVFIPRLHRSRSIGVLGFTAVFYAAARFDAATVFPGWAALAPVFGAAMLIASTDPLSRRVLSARPLVALGDVSYSLYLWHWPALVFARVAYPNSTLAEAGALVVSLALSFISYELIEQRAWSRKSEEPLHAVAAPFLLTPVVVAGVVIAGAGTGWGLDHPDELSERSAVQRSECLHSGAHRQWSASMCTWPNDDEGPVVFLVGDSHAAAIGDAVLRAAHAEGLTFAAWTRTACQFAMTGEGASCGAWQAAVLETLLEENPALVVVANRSTVVTGADWSYSSEVNDERYEALAGWREDLGDALQPLVNAGIPVLMVRTVPEFPLDGAEHISLLRPEGLTQTRSTEEALARRSASDEIETRLAESIEGVDTFDPFDSLCDEHCSSKAGESWLYYDDDHLSSEGSRLLEADLSSAIARALR